MKKHILVFDSGLGGTTILHEIKRRLPDHTYSYAMDNAGFPYGNKTNTFLLGRTVLFGQLIEKCQPDLIVIACNTASTLILDKLRSQFSIPFVGVVPAIKPAAEKSQTKVIGLLATEATVGRDYIKQLNEAHAHSCDIIHFGSQQLVEMAEMKIRGVAVDKESLQNVLSRLTEHPQAREIDTFVLGCTHFPAIKDEIIAIWPYQAEWIDSGEAIARRVEHLCQQLPNSKNCAQPTLYLSKDDNEETLMPIFLDFGIKTSLVIKME